MIDPEAHWLPALNACFMREVKEVKSPEQDPRWLALKWGKPQVVSVRLPTMGRGVGSRIKCVGDETGRRPSTVMSQNASCGACEGRKGKDAFNFIMCVSVPVSSRGLGT